MPTVLCPFYLLFIPLLLGLNLACRYWHIVFNMSHGFASVPARVRRVWLAVPVQVVNARAAELLVCLRERALVWLSLCHLLLGAAPLALKCLDALLHARAPCVGDPAFMRIRLEALLHAARQQVGLAQASRWD